MQRNVFALFGRKSRLAGVVLVSATVAVGVTLALDSNDASSGRPAAAASTGKPLLATRMRAARPQSSGQKSYLFAIDAHQGTLVPAAGGTFMLSLRQVHPNALYFTDRPARQVGTVGPALLMASFFGKSRRAQSSPNGVLNALNPVTHHQDSMGVEMLNGSYDAKANALTMRVKPLQQGNPAVREHGLTDVVLPRSFGHAALFIDDGSGAECDLDSCSTRVEFDAVDGSFGVQIHLSKNAGAAILDESPTIDCRVGGPGYSSVPYRCLVDKGQDDMTNVPVVICSDNTSLVNSSGSTCKAIIASDGGGNWTEAVGAWWGG